MRVGKQFRFILSRICMIVSSLSLCACLGILNEFREWHHKHPIFSIEFTIDGERFEDAAYGRGFGLDLGGYRAEFYSCMKDSVYIYFDSNAPYISLQFVDLASAFVEDKKYDYKSHVGFPDTNVHARVDEDRFFYGEATDGWYMFSRKPDNQYNGKYDEIEVYFEFDCLTESGETIEIRDGVFTCRRDCCPGDSLLVKESILVQ